MRPLLLATAMAVSGGCARQAPDLAFPLDPRPADLTDAATVDVGHIQFCRGAPAACVEPTDTAVLGEALSAEFVVDADYSRACSTYSDHVQLRVDGGAWVSVDTDIRGLGWCGVGKPTRVHFERGERERLPAFLPTRALDLDVDLDSTPMRFVAGVLPQLHPGTNALEMRFARRCEHDDAPVPVATGVLELVVPSEASLSNFAAVVHPRALQTHPRASAIAQAIRETGLVQEETAILMVAPERRMDERGSIRDHHQIDFITRTRREHGCFAVRQTLLEDRLGRLVIERETHLSSVAHAVPCGSLTAPASE